MPAQTGNALVLTHGPQGAQQDGGALVLQTPAADPVNPLLIASTRAPWSQAQGSDVITMSPMVPSAAVDEGLQAPWQPGQALDEAAVATWGVSTAQDRAANAPWTPYGGLAEPRTGATWTRSQTRDRAVAAPWLHFQARADLEVAGPWIASRTLDALSRAPWGEYFAHLRPQVRAAFAASAAADATRRVPWDRFARSISPGWEVVVPPNPTPDEPLYTIPIARYYVTINSISLVKMPGGTELRAYSFDMSLDSDSWTWSFNAALRNDALTHVQPVDDEPAELEAVVNGVAYRLLVDRVARDRQFPLSRISVSGRGLAASLAAPHAPIMSFANSATMTAQQLVEDVLTVNEVPLGWALEWGLTDWLVPAGCWALQGTYMDAVNDIVGAVGGYVQPHRTDPTLRILHRYPVAPWDWAEAAPDVELPAAAVEVEATEWLQLPRYNRVFVGGLGAGVFGPVTRAATAGDLVAPQVAHALITDTDAHRQRGLAELANTGRQAHLQLSTQVGEAGVIVPGTLLRYVGDETVTGMVRKVSLSWGRPVLRQTLGVETHVA